MIYIFINDYSVENENNEIINIINNKMNINNHNLNNIQLYIITKLLIYYYQIIMKYY